MMENLLSTSSPMIDTSLVTSPPERGSPVTVAEFDGETVLCRVCGDRASGFHYGVHACEGCKGFFRRSIQQKIQYRPCLKNQQCNIQRVNRNRCQYCRLKKCISVGMSRDAVRFGRVPKKEKARIIEQMQKKNLASQTTELNTLLANDHDVVHAVVTSHRHTCNITQFRAHQMRDLALHNQDYVSCPANMACPLNNEIGMDANANRNNLTDFSESFTPAIKSVVDFAKGIPGFVLLNQDDQVTLLKAGTFEVLLVRLACLFDSHSNTMMFTGGKLYKRHPSTMPTNVGFLLDSMFDFAERFNRMCLIDDEIAIFSAVVLMSPDRPGLRNVEQVERIQNKLTEALQNIINTNHKEDGTLFAKLLMKTTDLRTLNTLHSEKSIAGQRSNNERREKQALEDLDMDFQDSLSTRSGRSSPTLSETSNMTMTSSYSGETDGNNLVVGQRVPLDPSSHQQVVLRTPYGTFFREEFSGFYGMMADQPRRRCNTLDRDTLSRPRLHTIEEGNKRRYTLDRDYINKMVNRLSDRLEIRNSGRGESVPTSISNSAASSPIQEEGTGLYAGSSGAGFTPIKAPDGHLQNSGTRTSPLVGNDVLAAARAGSTPGSPTSRSRSGSLSQEDYGNMRPRCYSFHINSEGRAARMPIQRHLLPGEKGEEAEAQLAPDDSQYLSPEMRRCSVGAAYGLHNRKQSLLVDRPLSYVSRNSEVDKRTASSHGLPNMKHLMSDGSLYGMQLTPEMASQNPNLWPSRSAMAMNPPMSAPLMQRQREDLVRPSESRPREWDVVGPVIRELPREVLQRDHSRKPLKLSPNDTMESLDLSQMEASMMSPSEVQAKSALETLSNGSGLSTPSPYGLSPATAHSGLTSANRKQSSLFLSADNLSHSNDSLSSASRSKASSPQTNPGSKNTSERGSPVNDDLTTETFGHKKFDKFRKEKSQPEARPTSPAEDVTPGIKEERMEDEDGTAKCQEEYDLKVDVLDLKTERRSPYIDTLSPSLSQNSTPSPNSERPKLSAKEAHPNLLAHLMNGGGSIKQVTPPRVQPPASVESSSVMKTTGIAMGFPWTMPGQSAHSGPMPGQSAHSGPMPGQSAHSGPMPGQSAHSGPMPGQTSHLGIQQFKLPQFSHQTCSVFQGPSKQATISQQTNGLHPSAPSPPVVVSSQTNSATDQIPTNSKEEFHAVAVSHLKDKLMRKYDSMEHLNKIGKESQNGMVGDTPQRIDMNSPTSLAALSSTADLNKELATKLTLSNPTQPSPSSTSAFQGQGPRCPFSALARSNADTSEVFSHHSLPHPTTVSQHPSVLSQHPSVLSQHPNFHPVYHSMMSHQYPNVRPTVGIPQKANLGSHPQASNSQQFAQMYGRGQVTQSECSERRQELVTPLNLTSKMDEGPCLTGTAPSHSPQMPA